MAYTTQDVHEKIKKLLYSLTGITLTENKDIMISNRIDKLKRNCNNYGDIMELLDSVEKGQNVTEFINTFTTNKTHFFREEFHFEDLRDRVLPNFSNNKENISIWCSASSTGEEPYSIAMTVSEANEALSSNIKANIIATDIDTNVLQYAADGIYRYSKSSKEFPSWIKPQNYFKRRVQKNLSGEEVLIKVNDELKKMITFHIMNLSNSSYPFSTHQFDVIFCRNVFIYFPKEVQRDIVSRFYAQLNVGGYFILGHSETLNGISDAFEYRKFKNENLMIYQKVK